MFRRVSGGLVGALGGGVRSRLWAAATSMAAMLGSRGGGSRTAAAAPGVDEKPSVRGRAKEEGNIWGAFCPGGIHDPGQKDILSRVVASPGTKGVFGRAGKIPSPRPTFSPG